MPKVTLKVPDNDEGEDLGEYDFDFLPRVGDSLVLWHPALTGLSEHPFLAVVEAVQWEVFHPAHKFACAPPGTKDGTAECVVWITEEHGAPTIFCTCTPKEREDHGANDEGYCVNCGDLVPTAENSPR